MKRTGRLPQILLTFIVLTLLGSTAVACAPAPAPPCTNRSGCGRPTQAPATEAAQPTEAPATEATTAEPTEKVEAAPTAEATTAATAEATEASAAASGEAGDGTPDLFSQPDPRGGGVRGVARNTFQEALGPDVTLDVKTFNAGPALIEALFAGEVDLGYVGPNPAINGYVKSNGEALRIIAGASSAGALFVVRPESEY